MKREEEKSPANIKKIKLENKTDSSFFKGTF